MRTVAEHTRVVHALLDPVFARLAAAPAEHLPIDDPALAGRATATSLVSEIPLPPFDNSQMDGYAVRLADFPPPPSREPSSSGSAAPPRPAILRSSTNPAPPLR
ncbi:hypothetical protein [Leucobacter soli]|uniref:hypothetical protein n=1 Tax=Leucobacter soli TaxID=2812850 RepID=UPI0036141C50